tara:strand:- start:4618 stop:4776 length:159 start_codon:yes stop_codon:yes gene_type:complete
MLNNILMFFFTIILLLFIMICWINAVREDFNKPPLIKIKILKKIVNKISKSF